MAPTKFGLFKVRSRDNQEQPPTETLLHTSCSSVQVAAPQSPVPSTSKTITPDAASPDLSTLLLYSDDDILSQNASPSRSASLCSRWAESEVDYHPLKSLSLEASSSFSTLDDFKTTPHKDLHDNDDASTSYDAKSLQFDKNSIAGSDDVSVYCRTLKKTKKNRSKIDRHLRDFSMWKASNVEVMQNLLCRSGTLDDQIKWEAIATARGLCTLTDSCTCGDCTDRKFLAGMADGDGGLGAAPLLSAVSVGCRLQ